jgi:drug/metabolite transporter (DMT)-like permease
MAAATISWSAGSLVGQRLLRRSVSVAGTACQMICGGCALLVASVLAAESLHMPGDPAARLAWLYLVVFGSLVAYSAFIYLLAHTRTTVAMSYTFVNPFVALVLGIAFGAEQITWRERLAVAVIATGVALLLVKQSSRQRPLASV